MGEGRPGTHSHNKDRLCMEFVSPEIWVSSFSMFFDSFPQLTVRYLLNLATVLLWECQVWGLQALSLLPCLYMEAHTLGTHARVGTSSPWAHTHLCTGDTCLSVCMQRRHLAPCSLQGSSGQQGTDTCQHFSIHHSLFWHRHCCHRPIVHATDRFAHAKPT